MTNPSPPASNAGPKMQIHEVIDGPPHQGDTGRGLTFRTSRGELTAIMHAATDSQQGVIWVCGARGGFGGPASGLYARLAESFAGEGISSLRLNYRQPNDFPECMLDLLAGTIFLHSTGCQSIVMVGHSMGGAVVIAAGAASKQVSGVVALSPQTYGAHMAGLLSPKPLLVVHGKADTRLPYSCGEQIHTWAKEPKELVLYEGAEHRLDECGAELEDLLQQWIPATLAAALQE